MNHNNKKLLILIILVSMALLWGSTLSAPAAGADTPYPMELYFPSIGDAYPPAYPPPVIQPTAEPTATVLPTPVPAP